MESKKLRMHALGFVKKPEDIGQVYFGQGDFNFYTDWNILRYSNKYL